MKYKRSSLLTIFAVVILLSSLSIVSAENKTINNVTPGGILQGIRDIDLLYSTLTLNSGNYTGTGSNTGIPINKNIKI